MTPDHTDANSASFGVSLVQVINPDPLVSWQWFCGFGTMQHQPLMDPTTLSRWRSCLGADKLDILLKQTIDTAEQKDLLNKRDLSEVNFDTTVQNPRRLPSRPISDFSTR